MGAPFGNKNAAGGKGSSKKSGIGGTKVGTGAKALKFAPGKIHYDSPKFQAAARRQKRQGIKGAFTI